MSKQSFGFGTIKAEAVERYNRSKSFTPVDHKVDQLHNFMSLNLCKKTHLVSARWRQKSHIYHN